MRTTKMFLLLTVAAAALAGCAKKPPAELLGKWERVETLPFGGGAITYRLSLREDWKYTVSRKGISNPAGEGRTTADGLEVLHAGNYMLENNELVLTATENYLAGVDVGPLGAMKMRTGYSVSGNSLVLQTTETLFPPSVVPGGLAPTGPGPAPAAGPVTLTRVP